MNVSAEDSQFVYDRMSAISLFIYETMPSEKVAGYVLLAVIFLLSALVFKLGFARKLPVLKTILIYTFLFIGCVVLTFLALFLPIVEGLIVAALILIIYRVRRMNEYKDNQKDSVA